MAAQAVIGEPFTFHILFVDGANDPLAVVGPAIDIFSFSAAGAKNPLVTAGVLASVVPAETGRYVFVYSVPTTFTDGDMIYADITADDGGGNTLREKQEVVLIASTRGANFPNNAGLIARFVE